MRGRSALLISAAGIDTGIMSIACIIAHLSQIVLDSYLITQWIDGDGNDSDAKVVGFCC